MNKHLKCLRMFLMICGGFTALTAVGIGIAMGLQALLGNDGYPWAIGIIILSTIGFLTYTVCAD